MTQHRRWAPIRLSILFIAALITVGGASAEEAQKKRVKPTLAPAVPPEVSMYAASHVLVQWSGAQRASGTITRTKDEALERSRMVAAKAREGVDFAELARTYSDGPSAPQGGSLGAFAPNRMVPEFSKAVAGLSVGSVSAPVETVFGYHVIRRDPVELVSARHILIMHAESQRKPASVTRTKAEALERANEAQRKARAGDDFATLAENYSDGPSKTRGGDLGNFPRGRMVKAFDDAVFALDVDGISEVVETPFGYHVIQRYK